MNTLCIEEIDQRSRRRRRTSGRRAMGGEGRRSRQGRRHPGSLPARGAARGRRQTVPDLAGQGQSRAVPVLRTVPRRGRLQGAPGERAFQDLYRRAGAAAFGQTRTRAIRAASDPLPSKVPARPPDPLPAALRTPPPALARQAGRLTLTGRRHEALSSRIETRSPRTAFPDRRPARGVVAVPAIPAGAGARVSASPGRALRSRRDIPLGALHCAPL